MSDQYNKISASPKVRKFARELGVDITNVKGEMNDRQAYKYITSFAKKTRFEPLMLDGNVYQLSNLSGQVVAISGPQRDLEDNMPHDSGIWRN